MKELSPTRTCMSTSNSAAYVCDRLASYIARRLLGLDFVDWQQRQLRGWPWSGNSVQVQVLWSTDHMLH